MRTYVGRGVGAYFLNDLFLAENYVYVASRWISPEYAEKLVDIAREGVEVRVLTSDDTEASHQEALEVFRKSLKPKRKLFGLLIDKSWKPPNLELRIIKRAYLHVKLYVFDDKAAVTGSANFTVQGMWNNIEHVVIFDKPEEVKQIKKDFLRLWRLYYEAKETVSEVYSLEDVAKAIGKTVKELLGMFRKLREKI